jgi:hypothetical protein
VSMKNLPKRARTLVVAISVATTVLGLSALSVGAEPIGPTDPGVRCAAKVGPGQYEFYLPGEKATDVNGNKWVCGPDGQWFRDYSALISNGLRTSVIYTTAAVFK